VHDGQSSGCVDEQPAAVGTAMMQRLKHILDSAAVEAGAYSSKNPAHPAALLQLETGCF
jgi:hypothetical protein